MEVPVGTVYADLTVIKEVERSGYNRRFLCKCSCGAETTKFLGNLRMGRAVSCGHDGRRSGEAGRALTLLRRHTRAQITDEGRLCFQCDTWKPWAEFASGGKGAKGRSSSCIRCGSLRTILKTFAITREEYESLLSNQKNVCGLCEEPQVHKRMAVDHDHSCCGPKRGCRKCIRGLLCDVCNRLLGHVEQKPLLADRFSDYLGRRPLAAPRLKLAG